MIITLSNPLVVFVVLIWKCRNSLTVKMNKEPERKQHTQKSSLQKQISEGILCHYYTKCVVIRNVRNEATISFIIFGDFLMFYQFFFSAHMKRCVIISCKHGIYQLPHELPNDLTLRILGN